MKLVVTVEVLGVGKTATLGRPEAKNFEILITPNYRHQHLGRELLALLLLLKLPLLLLLLSISIISIISTLRGRG